MTRERAVKGPPRTKLTGRGVELTLHTEATFCDLNLTLSRKVHRTRNVKLREYYQKNLFSFTSFQKFPSYSRSYFFSNVTFCDLSLTLSRKVHRTRNVELREYYQKSLFSFTFFYKISELQLVLFFF